MKIPKRKGQHPTEWAAEAFQAIASGLRTDGLSLDASFLSDIATDYHHRAEDGSLVCSALDALPIYRGPK
jgi:hypothetical protein